MDERERYDTGMSVRRKALPGRCARRPRRSREKTSSTADFQDLITR